ncbi:hypothetical protein GSI_09499 [Ganoderma sinense ZZ0214-1]|uniref:F-box domain-containing protein n=1 Tax=Ganoderma sinense ZZ0214-1 TaxID=1077348 RepID=A0A2G8S460_9APHY|nr:hypothetical protein GSI_09499 [Ganoderma sinense ZZ0214-1]
MPALRSITICTRQQAVHGLSWGTVKMILSIPQIREVSIIGLLLSPSKLPDDDYRLDSLSPITAFHYEVFSHRFDGMNTRQNYPFPSELELLQLVLSRIHTSLERLVLSVEPALLLAMSQWSWPSLRELRLRGERKSRPPVPYITLLSAMPNLRTLALELTLVSAGCKHAGPLWPPGSRMLFPCRDLSHLSVAHPHPADELYQRLPSTIRALSLCCRPHKSEKAWNRRRMVYSVHVYEYPVLTPAEMLGILRSCRLPHLTRLEIEYQGDEEELGLLRSLAMMFPQLAWLQVHRYRDEGPESMSVVADDDELDFVGAIGRALSNLLGLRTFCGYLDLPHQPMILDLGPPYYDAVQIAEYTKTLYRVARTLAGTVPSLEMVYLWRPRTTGQIEWAPFEVVRGDNAPEGEFEIRCPVDVKEDGGPLYPVVPVPIWYNVDP